MKKRQGLSFHLGYEKLHCINCSFFAVHNSVNSKKKKKKTLHLIVSNQIRGIDMKTLNSNVTQHDSNFYFHFKQCSLRDHVLVLHMRVRAEP